MAFAQWQSDMVGKMFLHWPTGVWGFVGYLSAFGERDSVAVLDNGHALLLKSPADWLELTESRLRVVRTFGDALGMACAVACTDAQASRAFERDELVLLLISLLRAQANMFEHGSANAADADNQGA